MKFRTGLIAACVLAGGTSLCFASTTMNASGAGSGVLKGTFSPDNEGALLKQLGSQGMEYLNSYQHNADGSAMMKGIDARAATDEPVATINISKDGIATVSDGSMAFNTTIKRN